MDAPPSSSSSSSGDGNGNGDADGEIAPQSQSYQQTWVREQDLLRRKLVLGDDFSWALESRDGGAGREPLRYVGGVDVSFAKDDPSLACGALVVVDLQQLQHPPQQQQRGREAAVVHEAFELVRLRVPYIPGFLAFREAPILLRLLEKTKRDALRFYPQMAGYTRTDTHQDGELCSFMLKWKRQWQLKEDDKIWWLIFHATLWKIWSY